MQVLDTIKILNIYIRFSKRDIKKVNERLTQMESKMDRIEELLLSMQTNTQIPTETDSIETTETTSSQPITCTIRLSDDS